MVRRQVDQHMRPIGIVARGQIEPESDVGLPKALRMPRGGIGVTKVLQACDVPGGPCGAGPVARGEVRAAEAGGAGHG